MTPLVALRPFRPDDAEACAGVFARAWAAGHPHAPRRLDQAAFLAAVAGRAVLVAQDRQGAILGFVGIHLEGAFIHHLYVDPPASRQGVGRALLAAAVAMAGGAASLKCQLRNTRALAFYERGGWRRAGEGETDGERWVLLTSPSQP